MASPVHKQRLMALHNLEDAVLSLLGEGQLGPEEVTQTGTSDRGDQLASKVEARTRGPRVDSPIHLAPRRSANELPWTALGQPE